MPRLGEDANAASAYPDRIRRPILRGSWLRQLFTTAVGTLLLMLIMKKAFLTDYKVSGTLRGH